MKTIILDLNKQITDIEITEDTEVLGVWLGKNNETVLQDFNIIHNKPGLTSRITIKAILEDSAQLKLSPKLIIRSGAKFSDSYLKIAVLLLSNSAKAMVIPSLEIHENEVKAGHGATLGKIDQEQLLYLMSRGLPKTEAEKLLITTFIQDIMSKIAINK